MLGVGARVVDLTRSWAFIAAAGSVCTALIIMLVVVRQRVRDEAIELLLTGHQYAPIAAVENERRRLMSRSTRRALGKTYLTIADQARPKNVLLVAGARPLFQRRVVNTVIDELLAVGRALESDQAGAPAVARAERLITNGTSHLYGSDQQALKAELSRILDELEHP